jgi:predicted N-acetyltransferase YhbS
MLLMLPKYTAARSSLRMLTLLSPQRAILHRIRCATELDIPHIDACNRAYLPENYQHDYFLEQLKRWDDLSLVAVSDNNELVWRVHCMARSL